MAEAVTARLGESDPLLLCVLHGGLVTMGKLLTRLPFPLQTDYVHVSRYRGQTQGGELQWKARPSVSLRGRAVLVVDDILDEGYTLARILEYCMAEGAIQAQCAVLVEKQLPHSRGVPIHADYLGLTIPDRYVFGYGMDFKGYWRNAPGIYAVSPEYV
jgi:hypoxanthine phosphoribosyltransferase